MLDPSTIRISLEQIGSTVLLILLVAIVLEVALYFILVRALKYKYAIPIMLIAPAMLGLILLNIFPLFWELIISFTNMSLRHFMTYDFIGLQNYAKVFTDPVLKDATFFQLLGKTLLWTVINVVFHVSGGMILALMLNRPMRGRGIYRTILILPWALPQIIAVLAWRGEFHYTYGFINQFLISIGMQPVQWMTDPTANFAAMCIVNIWLGIPFMMVILLGGLQSINTEYYEAAEMDGATSWQQFWQITMPLMQPVMTPAIILGTVWTFNNFNVPFFINQNELETSDILVTALFRASFEYNRYGFAAAFAFVIFFMLLIYSIFYMRKTGALKGNAS